MSKRIFKRILLLIVVILLIFFGMALLTLGHEQNLLVKATNTHLNAHRWIPAHFEDKPAYFWQSNDKVLFARLDKDCHAEFVTVDVRSNVETVLKAFNAGSGRDLPLGHVSGFSFPTRPSHSTGHYYLPDVHLSPDGTHLMWWKNMGKSLWSISTLDGKPAQSWHTRGGPSQETVAAWSPDSALCVVCSLFTERFDVKAGRSKTVRQPVMETDFLYDNRPHHLCGLLPDNGLLYMIFPEDKMYPVQQITIRTTSFEGTERKWTLRLPYACFIKEMKLAPKGDRLAFLLSYLPGPPGPVFTRPLWKYLGLRTEPTIGLWVCRQDGSDMHEIGHIADKLDNPEEARDVPHSLDWTPNGTRLSFVCKDTLYTLPAE